MASTLISFLSTPAFLPLYSVKLLSHRAASYSLSKPIVARRTKKRRDGQVLAMGGMDLLGDFGARDPYPAEIESNFGENVIGNVSTEHKILIPNLSALSLAQRSCEPVPPNQPPMAMEDAEALLKKIVGWRLVEVDGRTRLQCLWKVRDYECGVELINRINKVAEAAGHYPNLHFEEPNQVRAELWTASIGGLSLNDFIVAAKIDGIETLDLVPKKRIWA